MKKKAYAFVLSLLMIISTVLSGSEFTTAAKVSASGPDYSKLTGYMEPEFHEISSSEISSFRTITKYSTIYDSSSTIWSDYEKYKTYYFYNQLSETQKAIWDRLDSIYASILNGTNSFSISNDGIPQVVVTMTGMSWDDIYGFNVLFKYSNPQYYFIDNGFAGYQRQDGTYEIIFTIYDDFVDESSRNTATALVKNQLSSMVSAVSGSSDEEKSKSIYDAIISRVEYNNDYIADSDAIDQNTSLSDDEKDAQWDALEQTEKTQSLYSALYANETVCAGYSLLYTALCNACGIDAISVTSDSHAWNQQRINGAWVIVDATWGDSSSPDYNYFEINSSEMNALDSLYAHQLEGFYSGLLQNCNQTSSSGYRISNYSPGTAAAPSLSVVAEGSSYIVTFDSSDGGRIYYTTDSTDPGIGQIKNYYVEDNGTASFSSKDITIKAISVKGDMLDSSVTVLSDLSTALPDNTETEQTVTPTSTTPTLAQTIVTSENATNGVAVSWLAVEGAESYEIQRSTSRTGTFETIGTTTGLTFTDASVKNKEGKTFVYRVICNGTGYYSSVSQPTDIYRLGTPKFTSAKNTATQSIVLKWKKNTKATGYEIKYTVGKKTKTVKVKKYRTVTKTLKKLKKSKTYKVYIRTYKKTTDGTYYSKWSSAKKVKIKQ